jgi:hypothetical protein
MEKYDDLSIFIKGYFSDVLPNNRISLANVDFLCHVVVRILQGISTWLPSTATPMHSPPISIDDLLDFYQAVPG